MKNFRYGFIAFWMLVCSVTFAAAEVSISIGLPNVSIGINMPLYPELVPVPGYPVYYAPRVDGNYFFYDGMYWVYLDDNWYASSWYNGPWAFVEPEIVPLFILRVPVRYYRQPPVYFHGWQSNAPPRWGQHWGHGWEERRGGWDRWNHDTPPRRAPLPVYQRQYSGDRYPRVEQQHTLRSQSYRYQPRDAVVRQHLKQQAVQKAPAALQNAPAQRGKRDEPAIRSQKQQDTQRSKPVQQGGQVSPRPQSQHQGGETVQKPAKVQPAPQQRGPAAQDRKQQPAPAVQDRKQQQAPVVQDRKRQPAPVVQDRKQQPAPAEQDRRQQPVAAPREQQAPRPQGQEQRPQGRGESQEPRRDQGQGQNKDDERGRGRNN